VKRVLTARLAALFILAVLARNRSFFERSYGGPVLCGRDGADRGRVRAYSLFPFWIPLGPGAIVLRGMAGGVFGWIVVLAAGLLACVGSPSGQGPALRRAGIERRGPVTAGYVVTSWLLIQVRGLGEPLGARLIFLMASSSGGGFGGLLCGECFREAQARPGRLSGKDMGRRGGQYVAGGLLGAAVARWTFFADLEWRHALASDHPFGHGPARRPLRVGLKRGAGVRTAVPCSPGHGGFLDRLDSLIVSGPVLFYYHQAFMT